QREDGLGLAVAPLLCRTTGRITLDDEQFRQGRVLLLAVGQLSGKTGDVQRALATRQVAGLPRRFTGPRGVYHLLGDRACFHGVLLEELLQTCTERVLNYRPYLGTDQLFLGLRRETGIGYLHRQDGDHALAHVVAREIDLRLLGDPVLLDVVRQGAGQRGAETD